MNMTPEPILLEVCCIHMDPFCYVKTFQSTKANDDDMNIINAVAFNLIILIWQNWMNVKGRSHQQ